MLDIELRKQYKKISKFKQIVCYMETLDMILVITIKSPKTIHSKLIKTCSCEWRDN